MIQKIYAPLKKFFAPPEDRSWLRAWPYAAAQHLNLLGGHPIKQLPRAPSDLCTPLPCTQ